MAQQGWYPDPTSPAQLRYFDGAQWTEHVHPLGAAGAAAASASPGVAASFDPTGGQTPPAAQPAAAAQPSAAQPAPAQPSASQQSAAQHSAAQSAPSYGGGFTSPSAAQPPAAAPVPAGFSGGYGAPHSANPAPYASYSTGEVTPRKGLGGGAIAAIVIGGVVLLGIVGIGIGLVATGNEARPSSSAAPSSTASPEASLAPASAVAVDRPEIPSADYVLPAGFLPVTHADTGSTYAMPEAWTDFTEESRQYYDTSDDEVSLEKVTYVGSWALSDSFEEEVVLFHSRMKISTPVDIYTENALIGFESTFGGMTWGPTETSTTATGLEMTKTVGVPADDPYVREVTLFIIGGGRSVMLLECSAYVEADKCDEADAIASTVWIEP